jgi:hypothetical protein
MKRQDDRQRAAELLHVKPESLMSIEQADYWTKGYLAGKAAECARIVGLFDAVMVRDRSLWNWSDTHQQMMAYERIIEGLRTK